MINGKTDAILHIIVIYQYVTLITPCLIRFRRSLIAVPISNLLGYNSRIQATAVLQFQSPSAAIAKNKQTVPRDEENHAAQTVR